MQFTIALMIFLAGVYYSFHLKGEPFRALGSLRPGAAGEGALSPFAALSSALCGTLGAGTVTAAVSALAQGGPGVLVYLWLGALTGCSLKYAEIRISMRKRCGALSGAMVALREKSPALGRLYALLCLPVALLGMGNLAQVQALSDALHGAGLWRPAVGLMVTLLLAALIAGGIRRIGAAASCALPAFAALYIALCLWTLWRFRDAVPGALGAILAQVRRPSAEVFTLGVSRGLFISEAGMGTAAFAHSQSRAQPRTQGALGVCEVLFSTLLCTLTSLVVLVTGVPLSGTAAQVAGAAFAAAMGRAGSALLRAMLCFFTLSTLPVWWFYGRQCAAFLWTARWTRAVYTALFLLTAFAGCLAPLSCAWALADACNLALALPGLAMLLLYRNQIGLQG